MQFHFNGCAHQCGYYCFHTLPYYFYFCR
jgi:hypothetical protein